MCFSNGCRITVICLLNHPIMTSNSSYLDKLKESTRDRGESEALRYVDPKTLLRRKPRGIDPLDKTNITSVILEESVEEEEFESNGVSSVTLMEDVKNQNEENDDDDMIFLKPNEVQSALKRAVMKDNRTMRSVCRGEDIVKVGIGNIVADDSVPRKQLPFLQSIEKQEFRLRGNKEKNIELANIPKLPHDLLLSLGTSNVHTTFNSQRPTLVSGLTDGGEHRKVSAVVAAPKYNPFEKVLAMRSCSGIHLPEWANLSHVELIHRQGLKAPPMVFEKTGRLDRTFYQLFLPQTASSQKESVLCCRKKSAENKFRFSLDPNVMTKKDNPAYVGKMSCKSAALDDFNITLADGVVIANVTISSDVGKRSISCELLNQYLNAQESGRGGRTLNGTIQIYMQPYIALAVESSRRAVLSVYNPNESDATKASNLNIDYREKLIVEQDYPLSVFLSFAIVCAAFANKAAIQEQ